MTSVSEMGIADWIILPVALLVIITSGLGMVESSRWWIRIWDFPRIQILTLGLAVGVAVLTFAMPSHWPTLIFIGIAALWQFYRIFPYTFMARNEVAFVKPDTVAAADSFSALTFNVLQHNRNYDRTLALLAQEDPDILLLLETDSGWADALAPFLAAYPTVVAAPLDNTYGLIFATRLESAEAGLHYLTEPDTPSIRAQLATPGGTRFRVIGLHPRPPAPGQDTDARDAEIAIAARHAAEAPQPTLSIGDFNDVAWSHTSQMFKRIGGYLDPRVGRGRYPTFPAGWPMLRWPLDHVFLSPEFVVISMRVLRNVGSDHLPVSVRLCLAPHVAPVVNEEPVPADAEDFAETREIIEDYKAGD